MGRVFGLTGLCLILVFYPAWSAQAGQSGVINFKVCWQTGPVEAEAPPDKCDQPGRFIRVEVRRARQAGKYRQSAQSPWRINYAPGELLLAVRSNAEGGLELELPPGPYFIRPLGENYHSVGQEFFRIKSGTSLKAVLRLAGNI